MSAKAKVLPLLLSLCAAASANEVEREGNINGVLSLYGAFNLAPSSASDSAFVLSMAKLELGGRYRWVHADVQGLYGRIADDMYAADPAHDRALARGFSYFEQMIVGVKLPVGTGLTVDAGKFVTPVGIEVLESGRDWNTSRSLLFDKAEPMTHFGVQASYDFSDRLNLTGYWCNGENTVVQNGSTMRTGGLQATWKPLARLSFSLGWLGGLDPHGMRNLVNFWAKLQLTRSLSMGLASDFGGDADGAVWGGAALYARYAFYSWLALAARGEVFGDPRGRATGAPQDLAEGTLTLEGRHQFWSRVTGLARLEYRHDHSILGDKDTLFAAMVTLF